MPLLDTVDRYWNIIMFDVFALLHIRSMYSIRLRKRCVKGGERISNCLLLVWVFRIGVWQIRLAWNKSVISLAVYVAFVQSLLLVVKSPPIHFLWKPFAVLKRFMFPAPLFHLKHINIWKKSKTIYIIKINNTKKGEPVRPKLIVINFDFIDSFWQAFE